MLKFKVGDKFKVVYSASNSQDLTLDTVHTLVDVVSLTENNSVQFYATDTGWYIEEDFHIENRVIIGGIDRVIAVLDKIEEPDT